MLTVNDHRGLGVEMAFGCHPLTRHMASDFEVSSYSSCAAGRVWLSEIWRHGWAFTSTPSVAGKRGPAP